MWHEINRIRDWAIAEARGSSSWGDVEWAAYSDDVTVKFTFDSDCDTYVMTAHHADADGGGDENPPLIMLGWVRSMAGDRGRTRRRFR